MNRVELQTGEEGKPCYENASTQTLSLSLLSNYDHLETEVVNLMTWINSQ